MRRIARIIVGAARANALPAAFLWMAAVALVAGYRFVPGVASALEPVAQWQARHGWQAAFLTQFFFCGLVPGVFLLTVRSVKTCHPLAKASVQAVWCGGMGIACWWFYGLQSRLFGDGCGVFTLVCKTLVDQFVWTAFVVSPLSALFFVWLGCDFSVAKTRDTVRGGFVSRVVMPNLVANWCVGIPATFILYAFPPPLQLQVSGFVYAFWILMCLQIGRRSAPGKESAQ